MRTVAARGNAGCYIQCVQCPRCAFEQPDAAECAGCGVIIAKWRARTAAPAAPSAAAPLPIAAPVARRESARASRAAVRDLTLGLSRLLAAGVSLDEALGLLAASASGGLRAALEGTRERVRSGSGLADAMSVWPGVFRPEDVLLVRVAEKTGDVAPALETLSHGIDASLALRRRLIAGLTYPALLLGSSILLGPIPKVLLQGGSYLKEVAIPLLWIGAAALGVVYGLPRLLRTPAGAALRRAAWSLPWPATVYVAHVRALFCRGLGRNVAVGLGLTESIRLAAEVTSDPSARDGAEVACSALRAGQGLSGPLGDQGLVARADIVLLVSGERSGTLDLALGALGDRYAAELARGLKTLMTVVNTILTIAVFAYSASGVIKGYEGLSGGTEDMMKQIEKEMPIIDMP